ncbi:MAG: VWA domain-containing protein [Deltaproteobacteria bacterium]|nr:VWA domain-containing protein [Deltaproteobacteria bacterium]
MTEPFFQYHSPLFFFLLIPVLFLFVFDLYKLHLVRFAISSDTVFSKAKKGIRYRLEFVPPLLRMAGLVLLVVVLARPQWGNVQTEVDSEGVDIVLALDTSGSMKALDLRSKEGEETNRLEVVKSVVADFIRGRQYDRIGMVVFGTQAYTQCPLTLDYDVLRGYLSLIQIGIAGEDTAIGNAIATAVKRLQKSDAKSKIIILLTDGENTAGEVSPAKAAELARDNHIKIYTIAIGAGGLVPVPVEGLFGIVRKVPMQLNVDEGLLKEIAAISKGRFFRARDTESLQAIYKEIDQMEKTEVKISEFAEFKEMYLAYLVPAIVLLILAWVLQKTVFLRVP